MPLRIEDRLGQYTTTTGTGAYTTAGLITAFRSLNDKLAINDYFYGFVEAIDANGDPTGDWECGMYTKTGANTFARTAIHSSSNNDVAVNWAAGTKRITLALTSYMLKYIDTAAKASTSPPPQVGEPAPGQPVPYLDNVSAYGSLTFRDEFDGSNINTAKWPMQRMWYEPAKYANRGNIDVNSGKMRLWATPWSTSADPTIRYPHEGGFGYKNHNATICTDGVFWQRYGYFEAKIKMPKGKGPFPAFWLYGHQDEAGNEIAERPELDIVECYPSGTYARGWSIDATNSPINHVCTVWQGDGTRSGYRKGNDVGIWNIDLSADPHVYGMHWDATGVQFFFDKQPFGERIPVVMTHPLYIILDYWMGGESGYANDPIGSLVESSANAMEVEYVRAWALADGSTYTKGTAVEQPVVVTPVEIVGTVDWYGNSVIYGWDPALNGTANEGDPVNITMPEAFDAFAPTSAGTNWGVNGSTATNALNGTAGVAWANWNTHISGTTSKYIITNYREKDSVLNLTTQLTTLVNQAKAAGKVVFILTEIPSLNSGALTHDQIAAAQRSVAYDTGVKVIDLNSYMSDYMLANGLTITDICPDTQHPTQQYYTMMGQWVKSKFVELLNTSNVQVRGITAGASSTVSATHTTASFTPQAGKMYLLGVQGLRGSIAASHPSPTVTGNGMTWQLHGSQDIDAGTGGYFGKLSLFKALATTSAGTVELPPADPAQTGNTYYVATNGSDAANGSSATPWLTIAKAISVATAGDTVIVKDGTYTASYFKFDRSGTALNRILFKAENKWGAKLVSTSTTNHGIEMWCSYVTLKDFELSVPDNFVTPSAYMSFVRAWGENGPGQPSPAAPNTGFKGCIFDGIKTTNGVKRNSGFKINQDDNIVRNCVLDNYIDVLNVKNVDVYNNQVSILTPQALGIFLKGGTRDSRIFNNVIYNQYGNAQGILLGGYSGDASHYDTATNIECYNCVAYNNVVVNQISGTCVGLAMQGAKDCGFYNNVTIGCTLAMMYGGYNTGPQATNTNPTFKNNIFVGNNTSYISSRGWVSTGLVMDYNLFHNFSAVPSQANPISGDPLFVDSTSNWNLTEASPARNKGTAIAPLPLYHGGTVDIGKDFGFTVRAGTSWDLGVYEYGQVASGPVTITFADTQIGTTWSLVEVSNLDTANPIVQTVQDRVDALTSLELTMAAFASPSNSSVAFFAACEDAGVAKTFNPGAGMTEVHDVNARYTGMMSQFKLGSTTKVAASCSSSANLAMIAVEIKSAN